MLSSDKRLRVMQDDSYGVCFPGDPEPHHLMPLELNLSKEPSDLSASTEFINSLLSGFGMVVQTAPETTKAVCLFSASHSTPKS